MQCENQLTDLLLFEKECLVNLNMSFNEIEDTSFYELIEVLNSKKEDKIDDPMALVNSINRR